MASTSTSTSSQAVIDRLRIHVADATVLWYALHNDHWFVTGDQFFTLHAKFEELYTRWGQAVDDLAERLLAIGGQPIGTLSESVELATIDERTGSPSAEGRVSLVIDALMTIHTAMGHTIEDAEAGRDRGTVNLLDGLRDAIEKDVWMLRAFNA